MDQRVEVRRRPVMDELTGKRVNAPERRDEQDDERREIEEAEEAEWRREQSCCPRRRMSSQPFSAVQADFTSGPCGRLPCITWLHVLGG